mmetsp:Transcript_17421/g.17150  ORF Transcript_17421/g.17150 Transcript_17421/m.17150 type:complete len:116 (+) Transcript_17421:1277-1624(+)
MEDNLNISGIASNRTLGSPDFSLIRANSKENNTLSIPYKEIQRPFSNDNRKQTHRIHTPFNERGKNKTKHIEMHIVSPISKERRLSRNLRVEAAIKNYKQSMMQIKQIRNKEEEK